jgi:hypothetical protein
MFVCFDDMDETESFEIIKDEESWNASYANGGLKKYYQWADSIQPYKEDLWNVVEHRAAGWADWHTAANEEKDENGNYIYPNCERCFAGALNAAEAAYPWCVPNFEGDERHIVRLDYTDETSLLPWGSRQINWGCESLPKKFNSITALQGTVGDDNKVTVTNEGSFDDDKLHVSIIDLSKRTVHSDDEMWGLTIIGGAGDMVEEEEEF